MKIFYFTSTGNNLHIAKSIGGELLSIPKVLKSGVEEFQDESIGIIFPCYAFGTPDIVVDFLNKVTLKADYVFGIMSYGNMEGAALHQFKTIAEKQGTKIDYLNSILMVDNAISVFEMSAQIENQGQKKIEDHLNKIIDDINSRKSFIKTQSLAMKGFSKIIQQVFARIEFNGKGDMKFRIEDSCNGCGICSKVCPVQNITVNGKPKFKHNCALCFACTHNCPQNAIRFKSEKSKVRFRNENVSLKEMIDSNNLSEL